MQKLLSGQTPPWRNTLKGAILPLLYVGSSCFCEPKLGGKEVMETPCSPLATRVPLCDARSLLRTAARHPESNGKVRSYSERPAGQRGLGTEPTLAAPRGRGSGPPTAREHSGPAGTGFGESTGATTCTWKLPGRRNLLARQTLPSSPLPAFLKLLLYLKKKAWHFSNTHFSKMVHLGY